MENSLASSGGGIGQPRSRLLGSSDHESLLSPNEFSIPSHDSLTHKKQLLNYFTDSVYYTDEWHTERYIYSKEELDDNHGEGDNSWRLKDRMKTVGVSLVLCLNIGIDPPDVVRPNPCARKECWYEPLSGTKQKSLEFIGNALQQQYEKWQSKAKYKQCLDPTSEELRRTCINLRKNSKADRLLLHFNGHGVPKPTKNGEIWVFGKHYTHYTPVSVCELRSWIGDPAIYVLDCSAAGVLISHLVDTERLNTGDIGVMGNSMKIGNQSGKGSTPPNSLEVPTLVLAACMAHEVLPMNPQYPADIFTACLTTPIVIAIRWFILQNPYSMNHINPDIAENIPGRDNDRKTPRGELNWIFTTITDTIAWTTLPSNIFQRMFRQDLLVASLFRNFLLAKRIMKSFNCTPQSWPPFPDSTTHPLWQSWDLTLETFITNNMAQLNGQSMIDRRNNMLLLPPQPNNAPNGSSNGSATSSDTFNSVTSSNLTFFNDQLTAFELWLDFGLEGVEPPSHLPIVLQLLLSQTYRLRALQLLKRFLALGSHAVKLALMVGIFPYIVKLLQSPIDDSRQILISIWASIIGFDPTCRQELIQHKSVSYFIQSLSSKNAPLSCKCMAAFVLAELCNECKEGQQICLQEGLHRSCTTLLSQPHVTSSTGSLKTWLCLCLFRLCENFLWSKYLLITEAGHTHLYSLLLDPDPLVRGAAVLALGEIFGASTLSSEMALMRPALAKTSQFDVGNSIHSNFDIPTKTLSNTGLHPRNGPESVSLEKDLREAEIELALQILECCLDGSVVVRLEAMHALSKFFLQDAHIDCLKLVANVTTNFIQDKSTMKTSREVSMKKLSTPNVAVPSVAGNYVGGSETAGPVASSVSKPSQICPWHLSPSESREVTAIVEKYLESKFLIHSKGGGVSLFDHEPGSGTITSDVTAQQSSANIELKRPSTKRATDFVESLSMTDNPPQSSSIHHETANPRIVSQGQANHRDRSSTSISSTADTSASTPALPTLMASAYLRLWLALREVQTKDPHPEISKCAGAICNRILFLVAHDEKVKTFVKHDRDVTPNNNYQEGFASFSTDSTDAIGLSLSTSELNINALSQQPDNHFTSESLAPMGLVTKIDASPRRKNQLALQKKALLKRNQMEESMYSDNNSSTRFHNSSTHPRDGLKVDKDVLSPNSRPTSSILSQTVLEPHNDLLTFSAEAMEEIEASVQFSSNFYLMNRKLFLMPDLGYDPYADPLSVDGMSRLYRNQKLMEIIKIDNSLKEIFKDLEDTEYDSGFGMTSSNGMNGSHSSGNNMYVRTRSPKIPGDATDSVNQSKVASIPSSAAKFEQKAILSTDNPLMSLVMFHAFQDILAVCDGSIVAIWSLATNSKIMEIDNRMAAASFENFKLKPNHSTILNRASPDTEGNSIVTTIPASSPRVTSMMWINESYESLLLLGSDDGLIKIWRDVANSDIINNNQMLNQYQVPHPVPTNSGSNHNSSTASVTQTSSQFPSNHSTSSYNHPPSNIVSGIYNYPSTHKQSSVKFPSYTNNNVELAASFSGLPDVSEVSRGSGIVMSWQQQTGTLVVGGNSSTIRVWDLGREQCIRIFSTGVETCLTAIASKTISLPENQFVGTNYNQFNVGGGGGEAMDSQSPYSWNFAGFADGSVGAYDERVYVNGGRVHYTRDHSAWIISAYVRADVPQVITGSVRGTVKFWDLRTMKIFKTLEVQKSPLTALSIHNSAPVMATGSHAQFIKILTLGGELLGSIIKYHDGFMGQRLGAVSSLAFHPYRMLLAACSTDSIVSIYATSDSYHYH